MHERKRVETGGLFGPDSVDELRELEDEICKLFQEVRIATVAKRGKLWCGVY